MATKQNFNILDCTLRDGGYYSKWNFSNSFVRNYLATQNKISTDIIEIGFRKLSKNEKNNEFGNYLFSNRSILKKININKNNFKVSVMIDLSDYLDDKNYKNLDKLFNSEYRKYVSIVRIACSYEEIYFLPKIIKKIDSLGFKICVNLMKFTLLNNLQIYNYFYSLKKLPIDFFYLADSFGNCTPIRLANLCEYLIKKKINIKKFGFHAHDNLGLALKNSVTAIKYGFCIIDTSVMGMGRGAGNLKLEDLIKYTIDSKPKLAKIKNFNNKFMKPLKRKFNWGSNSIYKFSAKNSIHPTYVQRLLDEKKFKLNDITQIMNFLKKERASKYDTRVFDDFFLKKVEVIKKNDFLTNYKKAIICVDNDNDNKKKLIKNFDDSYLKCSLNLLKKTPMKHIDCIFQCNPFRIFTEFSLISSLKKIIVTPAQNFASKKNQSKKNIYFYNILKSSKPSIKSTMCTYNKNFALYYALSFLVSNKFEEIKILDIEHTVQNNKIINDIKLIIKNSSLNTKILY